MNMLIVVPDEFDSFADKPSLLRYGVLLKSLRSGDVQALRGQQLVAGQGLDEMQIDHAYCFALSLGLDDEFKPWRLWRQSTPADRTLCHKDRPENVLITLPEQEASDMFVADLRLHARNELMLDHLTGEHVQGMVLVEACRQMFLAVTERYHLESFPAKSRYFVINEMALRYLGFAFPLPAQIRYRVLSLQQDRPDRLAVHADMEVWQGSKAVTGMNVKFTVFDAKPLGERESRLANEVVHHYLNAARVQLQPDERSAPKSSDPSRPESDDVSRLPLPVAQGRRLSHAPLTP